MNNSKNQMRIFSACIIFIFSPFISAGEIIVNKIPGAYAYANSIVFTDDLGKVIKKLNSVGPSIDTQLTTSTGAKLNRSVELIGNGNFVLMAESTWPEGPVGYERISVVVHLYNKKADKLFTLRGKSIIPVALSETGVSVFIQSPPELECCTEDDFDVITVYDKAKTNLFEHKEYPGTISAIRISLNAKWLVFTVRPSPHKSSWFMDLVRVNLETQQFYTESAKSIDPLFSYHYIQNDVSLTKTTDFRGSVLPDGSRKRIKKTHVLREGIRQ